MRKNTFRTMVYCSILMFFILLLSPIKEMESKTNEVRLYENEFATHNAASLYRENNLIETSNCEITVDNSNPNIASKIQLFVENITCIGDYGAYTTGQNITFNDLTTYKFDLIDISLNNLSRISGNFLNQTVNGSWVANIDTIHIPESTSMAIKTNFSNYIDPNDPYSIEFSDVFEIRHKIFVDYSVKIDNNQEYVNIVISSATSTYNSNPLGTKNGVINDENTQSAKYIIKSKDAKEEILQGDLTFNNDIKTWGADVPLKDFSKGEYFVVLKFEVSGHLSEFIIGDEPSETNSFNFEISSFMLYLYIIVGFSIIALVGLGLYLKKAKRNVERQSVEKKSRPIEVVEISRSELKKTRISAPPVKKKETTVNKTGLIFNVPTWEVEEDEVESIPDTSREKNSPESLDLAASSVAVPISNTYTLHCPGCNSWYEIESYEKMNCPKCSTDLEVAMWCKKCGKWFDVAEPMEVNCPICNSKLAISK